MALRSPAWLDIDYWALDLETSGLRPRRDRILSVGMVPIRGGVIRWGERYYSLVRPARFEGLDGEAVRIHHILPGELADAPPAGQVLAEVMSRIGAGRLGRRGALLVHGASLDVAFLRRAARAQGLPWLRPPVIDTRALACRLEDRRRALQPFARPFSLRLPDLSRAFGLPPFRPHHALVDALATAQLFLVLRARLGARTLRQVRAGRSPRLTDTVRVHDHPGRGSSPPPAGGMEWKSIS